MTVVWGSLVGVLAVVGGWLVGYLAPALADRIRYGKRTRPEDHICTRCRQADHEAFS